MEIKIPTVDTLAEAAKEFLQKVVTPPLEEVGLLFSDQVKLWRFKNQVNILHKAEQHLKSRNLNTRKVSLKVLTPLLENSAVEEDESLQNKWAALIANTVRENSGLDTTLYSHILSQLSCTDAEVFEMIFDVCVSTSADGKMFVLIGQGRMFNYHFLYKQYNNINLTIDNLLRLRLVAEHSNLSECVILTSLGFSFMDACRFQ